MAGTACSDTVDHWRSISPEEQRQHHPKAISRAVAISMAIEGEPRGKSATPSSKETDPYLAALRAQDRHHSRSLSTIWRKPLRVGVFRMIHVHRLDGCSPVPLAHYLKALGILRLVAEQKDPDARGWWDGDRYLLASRLSREELEGFFLYDYQPTPLVSPWNKGAGFLFKKDPALSPIENSTSRRFASFRNGIRASRSQLEEFSDADREVREIKAETKVRGMSAYEKHRIRTSDDYKRRLRKAEKKFKQLKAALIPTFRLNWRGPYREWMDAAMVLEDDGTPRFPALLGTGGNDGRLDFTNNFMKRLGEVFELDGDVGKPRPTTPIWVSGALWSTPAPGNLSGRPVGQFLPGTAGGANNGNGPDSDSLVNPVDFILMLEGTIAFTSSASRRFGSSKSARAASPFVVNACAAAYTSASSGDESARGEQWMPLWSRPSTYAELRQVLAEGRVQVGVKIAREPLDFVLAAKRFGTARGIKTFQRYGYIERNGQSNLAVPLGRFDVADNHSGHLACIDDLGLWLRRLRREARDRNAPGRLAVVEKRLVDVLFAVAERPESPEKWQNVLLKLVEAEKTMAHGYGFAAGPAPRLRPEWVTASHDGTPEFRLALAFALQANEFRRDRETSIDPIRRHWLPLDREQPWRFATTGTGAGARLEGRPEVVMQGRRGLDDAVALIERRLVEASQRGVRYLSLVAFPRTAAATSDLAKLLAGGVDLDHTLALARALMALDRKAWTERQLSIERPRSTVWPDDAWLAIRLCTLPWPIETRTGFKLDIGTDPALIRRLATGDTPTATTLALRRLGAAGVRCTVRFGATASGTARLWAAALAFPITQGTARRFLNRLDPNKESS